MAVTPRRLVVGSQLTDSIATYYTAGTGVTARIEAITITNTSGNAETFDLHLVPLNGTADATNIIADGKSVASGATYRCVDALNHIIESGGTIQALASTAATLTLVVSGSEKTDG